MSTRRICRLLLTLALLLALGARAHAEPEIRDWRTNGAPLAAHLAPDRWTLLMIWSVTCAICARETPDLSAFHASQSDVRLLGVSIDGAAARADVARWMKTHEMAFPTLLGSLSEVAAFFTASAGEALLGTPTFMIFDRTGRLVGINPGPVRVQAVQDFVDRKGG